MSVSKKYDESTYNPVGRNGSVARKLKSEERKLKRAIAKEMRIAKSFERLKGLRTILEGIKSNNEMEGY
jgi:hypothetical protein